MFSQESPRSALGGRGGLPWEGGFEEGGSALEGRRVSPGREGGLNWEGGREGAYLGRAVCMEGFLHGGGQNPLPPLRYGYPTGMHTCWKGFSKNRHVEKKFL